MYQPYPGGAEMPEVRRAPAPASVRNAVKVMYAGAVASLIGIIIELTTLSATKSAIEQHFAELTASQVNGQGRVLMAGWIVGGLLAAGLWIFVAQACMRGKSWARTTGTVLFGIDTLQVLGGLAVPVAAPVKLVALVVWLLGLAAITLLWQGTSSAFFKGTPS